MQQISAKIVYKSKHDWVEKVIYRELCKKFKFDHTNKWYMHKPESVLENETHKFLWDFQIQTDNLILIQSTWTSDNQLKKENLANSELCLPLDRRVKFKKS